MQKELAIIFVSHKRIAEKGGIESMIKLLINKLFSLKVQVSLVYRELYKLVGGVKEGNHSLLAKESKEFGDAGTKNFHVPELIFLFVNLLFSFLAALNILSLVKNYRKNGYPVVIHAMDTVYGGLAASLISLLAGVPFVAHTHGVRAYFMHTTSNNNIVKTIDFLVEKVVTTSCSVLISVNQQAHDFWVMQGVPKDKIKVIPVPVDTKLFAPSEEARTKIRRSLKIPPESIVFGYVGRLSSEKISCSLLESFYRAKINAKLVIIGNGPLMPVLKDCIKSKDMDKKAVFTGFISNVHNVINAIDVLILPSYIEGMPTVILEAFSNGKTVVASDIPANREIIMDEIDGILFDPRNIDQLKDVIIRLYENPVLRTKLAANGLKKALNYDINTVLLEIFDVYRKILSK